MSRIIFAIAYARAYMFLNLLANLSYFKLSCFVRLIIKYLSIEYKFKGFIQ